MNLKIAILGLLLTIPVFCVNPQVEPKPEKAIESIYYDVPLDSKLQDFIIQTCEEHHISPALVIAMIGQESQYNTSAVGDNGNSVGLMQIQERWHRERMDRLGCTNLKNPYQNITVGVDLLAELYEMNPDTYWVLMAYNGGTDYADNMMEANTYSTYAVEVSAMAAELENIKDGK